MRKCTQCSGNLVELNSKTLEGVAYSYFKCQKCGEEIVYLKQLHDVAKKYKEIKSFHAKISKWGFSLGLRIPKELVKKYNFRDNEIISIIPEEKGIRIVPS